MAQRLLDRIKRGKCRFVEDNDNTITAESVARQLTVLLNTHRGGGGACPAYGLPDLGGPLASPNNAKDRLRDAIRESVRQFEPRIRVRSIQHHPGLRLGFILTGSLMSHSGPRDVTYTIEFSGDRRVQVTRTV